MNIKVDMVLHALEKFLLSAEFMPTGKGTLHLAVFVDLFSRKVVGWSMGSRMKDDLVIEPFFQSTVLNTAIVEK